MQYMWVYRLLHRQPIAWCCPRSSFIAASRLRIQISAQPFAMAFFIVLLMYPFELLGSKLLWWTLHDTDPYVQDRVYNVPISTIAHLYLYSFAYHWAYTAIRECVISFCAAISMAHHDLVGCISSISVTMKKPFDAIRLVWCGLSCSLCFWEVCSWQCFTVWSCLYSKFIHRWASCFSCDHNPLNQSIGVGDNNSWNKPSIRLHFRRP